MRRCHLDGMSPERDHLIASLSLSASPALKVVIISSTLALVTVLGKSDMESSFTA